MKKREGVGVKKHLEVRFLGAIRNQVNPLRPWHELDLSYLMIGHRKASQPRTVHNKARLTLNVE
ncbi:hypothetical protein E2C01_092989 [Portunus trituberculatus]|uniref:Uncharacterized protein n=1 Tax=Portunus trituberculatus TaxID=210409 RepID=A0A5B7JSV8_PORTR|nr:hypothetical protein [Portunus trituberculatus]